MTAPVGLRSGRRDERMDGLRRPAISGPVDQPACLTTEATALGDR